MRVENFFGRLVNIGSLREEEIGTLYSFIKEDGDNYAEMKNFVELTKDRKVLFDVGCAHGDFCLAFCDTEDKMAYGFDAAHQTQLAIIENIALNPKMRIQYNKLFLGDKDAIISYNSKTENALAVPGEDRVIMLQMDSFCALTNARPDTIKIDTEGFEYNVLAGARGVITECKPLMFIELHPKFTGMYGTHIGQVFDIAKELNYSIKGINGENVVLEMILQSDKESVRTVWRPR